MRHFLLLSLLLFSSALAASGPANQFRILGDSQPRQLRVEVHAEYPHDTDAFTQGLLLHEGDLYESTGRYGESQLRRVDLQTGDVQQSVNLSSSYFGEGLALVGNDFIQLTWRSSKALVYDRETFTRTGEFTYQGQGWGLCYNGDHLIMSDGSSTLTVRSPTTFAPVDQLDVTVNGEPVENLNELEYVEGFIYANIWKEDNIVKIDPADGKVVAVIDASGLLTSEERSAADVLNGIAYDPDNERFLITGKLWPKLFEVEFLPTNADDDNTSP